MLTRGCVVLGLANVETGHSVRSGPRAATGRRTPRGGRAVHPTLGTHAAPGHRAATCAGQISQVISYYSNSKQHHYCHHNTDCNLYL